MRAQSLSLLFFLLFSVAACQRDDIRVYRVPKSSEASVASAMLPAATSSSGGAGARWKIPAQWIAQPPSEMRVGSFLIKGKNGQTAEVSVIPLAGSAGGDLANVNRWRQQIDLSPLTEEALSTQLKALRLGAHSMMYVNFVSRDKLVDGKYKKRVIGAWMEREGATWFFKMFGEDATVLSAEPDFRQFLSSVEFPTHE